MHSRLSIAEIFGLSPVATRLRETLFMLRGDPYTPPSRFGVSSLKVLRPGLSLRMYLGITRADRRTVIFNLFNHTPTPVEDGWSVRVTQVRDFRGGRNTYDSHNGTDFAVPPGTVVVSAAPGVVLRVASEFHRGGLKVFIDHGHGIVTTSNHLGRSLVKPGQRVRRGEPVALSGSSGVDCVAAFPWSAPHVHYNVWHNGVHVDPFSCEGSGEPSLWRRYNDPVPFGGPGDDLADDSDDFRPTEWELDAMASTIAGCQDPDLQLTLLSEPDPARRAMDLLFSLNYFPTRFADHRRPYTRPTRRQPLLDLPFGAQDYDGVVFLYD